MHLFNVSAPLIRCKQDALDVQDLRGLLRIEWRVGEFRLFSGLYTRIDQIFLVWGWITAAIFAIAHFSYLSWHQQAVLWSTLTLVGIVAMPTLAWFWVKVEDLRWIIYAWSVLMLAGIGLTDCGIFLGWSWMLTNLCQLWLGLSTIGYFLTGWGLVSRTFVLAGLVHLGGILLLPYAGSWPFLLTGGIMAGTLLFLSEVQWDMRPPSAKATLSPEENAFNQQQQRRRERAGLFSEGTAELQAE